MSQYVPGHGHELNHLKAKKLLQDYPFIARSDFSLYEFIVAGIAEEVYGPFWCASTYFADFTWLFKHEEGRQKFLKDFPKVTYAINFLEDPKDIQKRSNYGK